ncbi:XdhC family protein [Chryseobacterium sp. Leaf201]|uniref:XdhC family protein n=1 Tax=Chryseobacterium sp. Leaf201 TaxID=1735672 RepID=UPI000701EEF0|nr:XdhC/CoxI family protein [Chryseobacterium sp. Leaf201]KQM38756.1 alanine dehydrogenase [Chryseobacterium sp. Leaf201]
MKEINDIIRAYRKAEAEGIKTALATVVKVTGSSYRQPGARMLVTEDGQLTGAISGGCLEGDALKKALLAIQQQQNKLVTYDTSNDEDADFGVQLGCNGIVHILFEPINSADEHNPVKILEKVVDRREDAVLVCLFSLTRGSAQPGTVLLYRKDGQNALRAGLDFLSNDLYKTLENKATYIKNIIYEGENSEALIEYIVPAVSLIIAGAGNDVKPLTEIASVLGWEVTVGEGRPAHATAKRFPLAKTIKVSAAEEFLNDTVIDEYTFFVLMTHNYRYDLTVLKDLLIHSNSCYIGILGPKTKLNRMIDDLAAEGFNVTPQHLERIHGPVGLDIGAETSEEIALSIVSEIKAVLEGRKGSSLKYKTDKIHNAVHGDGDK